jgi:hypothetical protein
MHVEAADIRQPGAFEAARRPRESETNADEDGTASMTPLHPFAEQIGPFYSASGAAHLLGLTAAELADARDRWQVLAMETKDGVWVYPAFQLDEAAAHVKPWLGEVLTVLVGRDRWTVGLWLTDPQPELEGQSIVEAGDAGVSGVPLKRLALLWVADAAH